MITKEQCRAARGLLGLKQSELAEDCGMSKTAITNFESGAFNPRAETMALIRQAFERRNVEFIGNHGVQKRQIYFKILDNKTNKTPLPDLWDDIFETLKDNGGEVLISNLDERASFQSHPAELAAHLQRLKDNNITERLLVREGDTFFVQDAECYRWLSNQNFRTGVTFFLYGGRLALQFWDSCLTIIIEHPETYQKEKERFEDLWSNAIIPPYKEILQN